MICSDFILSDLLVMFANPTDLCHHSGIQNELKQVLHDTENSGQLLEKRLCLGYCSVIV